MYNTIKLEKGLYSITGSKGRQSLVSAFAVRRI